MPFGIFLIADIQLCVPNSNVSLAPSRRSLDAETLSQLPNVSSRVMREASNCPGKWMIKQCQTEKNDQPFVCYIYCCFQSQNDQQY